MQEPLLLCLLRKALAGKTATTVLEPHGIPDDELSEVLRQAQSHQVLPLLYDVLCREEDIREADRERIQRAARKTVSQNFHLFITTRFLTENLKQAGIPVAVLKGWATASYYPVPELRKSGDVDLLLAEPEKMKAAIRTLKGLGARVMEHQPSLHHVVLKTAEGIEVELHTMIAEPFDNQKMNAYMEQCRQLFAEHVTEQEILGCKLPVLLGACHGYELLLHMLQHFLRAGFGLKLLCDWVVFWQEELPEKEQALYLKLVRESGLKNFSDLITESCVRYLGLPEEKVCWMQIKKSVPVTDFMQEVMEAGEFGRTSKDRMVALRQKGPAGYVREFHHQMHLNFPSAGRWVPLWPVLWILTLYQFLRNNRRVRKTSSIRILRKAALRGKLVSSLQLFRDTER